MGISRGNQHVDAKASRITKTRVVKALFKFASPLSPSLYFLLKAPSHS